MATPEHPAANTPVISRGQTWADPDGNEVVIADFCEYTAGWFVRIEAVEGQDDLFHEPKFRDRYRLVRDV